MIVLLKQSDLLRLRRSSGTTIDVIDGRVWVSEEGGVTDAVLEPGQRHAVASDGLILVGAERDRCGRLTAQIVLQSLATPYRFDGYRLRAAIPIFRRWCQSSRGVLNP